MELVVRPDTQKAYDLICEKIITLELPPGHPIHEQELAENLDMALSPVQEALKLLAADHLVRATARYGFYVADVNVPDLDQLSELRLSLEGLAARLAAQRAAPDDIVVLQALREEQMTAGPVETRRLFDIDHKFHQAIARTAGNRYLAQTLDHFFGLSLRLWYLVLPHLAFLPGSVGMHPDIVDAIARHDPDAAEQLMREHVSEFYKNVRSYLLTKG